MDLAQNKTIKIVAVLLLLTAVTQPIYTALYVGAPDVSRSFLWGVEGLLFVLLVAFAGSALVMAKRYTLGFSAIASSAALNIVQVGVGYTQFGPFRQAAEANAELGAIASSVVALSFFIYNAAKVLLGLAAVVFGIANLNEGRKALGGATALVGVVAVVANAIVMVLGIKGVFPSPIAGGSGVVATLLLSACLFRLSKDE